MIPFEDRGLLLGDGLFETLRAEDGKAVRPQAHLARLTASCAALGLPAPGEAAFSAAIAAALAGLPETGAAAVRVTWTAGSSGRGLDRPEALEPVLFARAAPYAPPSAPVSLALSPYRRSPSAPSSRHKTLSYIDNVLSRRAARAQGADEALVLNTDGCVAGAAAANLFWVEAGALLTPGLDLGVLAGVTRAEILHLARKLKVEFAEIAAPVARVLAADAIFICNSLIGVAPVVRIDGQPVRMSRLSAALSAALKTEDDTRL